VTIATRGVQYGAVLMSERQRARIAVAVRATEVEVRKGRPRMRTGPAREKADFPRIVRMGNPAEVRGAPMKTPRTLSIDCVGRCGGYPSALKHRRHSVKSESSFSNCT